MSEISEYLAVRAHGIMARLIPPQSLVQIAFSKELKDFVSLLMMTDYRVHIDKLSELSADHLCMSFKRVWVDRFMELIRASNGIEKAFLVEYSRIIEIENLLQIIGSKLGLKSSQLTDIYPIGIESISYDELVKESSIEQLIKGLTSYEPYKDLSPLVIERFFEEKNLLLLEYELHKLRYRRLLEIVDRWLFLEIRDLFKKFIGIEIDVLNIFTISGAMMYNYSPDIVSELIIPGGYSFSKEKMLKLIDVKRKNELVRALRGYSDVVERILSGEETSAYIIAQKKLRREILREKIPYYTSFMDVYLCLKLTEFEYRDLAKIAYSIEYNIPREVLQRNLINY